MLLSVAAWGNMVLQYHDHMSQCHCIPSVNCLDQFGTLNMTVVCVTFWLELARIWLFIVVVYLRLVFGNDYTYSIIGHAEESLQCKKKNLTHVKILSKYLNRCSYLVIKLIWRSKLKKSSAVSLDE